MLSPSLYSVLKPIKITENIIIKRQLDNPFSVRPLHDKLKTANKGQPTSPIVNLISHHKTKTKIFLFLCVVVRAF